jgi:WD40 repeat protein/tetratricopeptide (TPR) repeat protein
MPCPQEPTPAADGHAPRHGDLTQSVTDPQATTGGKAIPFPAPALPPSAERYTLLEEIARGGMGVIYQATDTALGREVAVKVLQERFAQNAGVARRFADEAHITAQLQHPGIPPVHDVGTLPDGRPFLAMKLIKGQTLEALLQARPDVSAERGRFVAVFEQVCQAIAYAHAHDVIHRDLKPANVMVGAFGEVQVMDWGLAKVLGADPADTTDPAVTAAGTRVASLRDTDGLLTEAGSVLGTPAYMPPEQAVGAIAKVDQRSDVFGLGAILAVILTGRPPFAASSAETTRVKAAQGDVAECLARLDASGAEPELAALCKRCLSPRAADRLADAGAVAAAVAGLRAAADERARRAELDRIKAEGEARDAEARTAEHRRWRRLLLTASALIAVVLLAGLCVSLWQMRRAMQAETAALQSQQSEADRAEGERLAKESEAAQRQEAEIARGKAETQERIALEKAELLAQEDYINRVNRAYREVQNDNIRLAEALLHGCPPRRRGWEWHFVKRLAHLDRLTLGGGSASVEAIAFSPDGKWVVTGAGAALYGGPQVAPSIRVWDVATGAERRALLGVAGQTVTGLAFSPDGARIAACGGPQVIVWDASNGAVLWTKSEPADADSRSAMSISFTPDGRSLAVGYGAYAGQDHGYVKIWDVAAARELFRLPGPAGGVNKLAAHPDGKQLALAGSEVVELWDLAARAKKATLRGHKRWVFCLAFSPDGKRLATGGWDRAIRLWDPRQGDLERVLYGHEGFVTGLAFSPDGTTLASTSEDRSVRLWDPQSGQLTASIHGHESFVQTVAFRPDGREFATGGDDGHFKIWDVRTCTPVVFKGHRAWVESLAVRRDGRRVLSEAGQFRTPDDSTRVWDPSTGQDDATLAGADRARIGADFLPGVTARNRNLVADSPDGRLVAAAAGTGSRGSFGGDSVVVRERGTGRIRLTLVGHSSDIVCLLFSPDGSRLATASDDRTIKLWDTTTGREVFTLLGHTGGLRSLAFSPDGHRIISGAVDATARVWDATPLPSSVLAEQDARYERKQGTRMQTETTAEAHNNLGIALHTKGRADEAIAEFKKVIELDPKDAHVNKRLGEILCDVKRDFDGAIACFRRAIALDPKDATAHLDLGIALAGKGEVDEAIACWRQAILLDPKLAPKLAGAHFQLGYALSGKRQFDEAMACYQRAIELAPEYAEAHCNLGEILRRQGHFAKSLAAYKRGHELGTKRPGWPYPSAEWVREAEGLVAMESKLPAFLKGQFQPRGTAELLGLAGVCQVKKLYAAAVRLYAEAFAADPKLADSLKAGHRYNAACYAALAGAGQGEDTTKLDDKERSRLRQQARDWLRADLVLRGKQLESGQPADRAAVQQALRHWQQDSDLVGIRDAAALAKSSGEERAACEKLWADVAALLKKAEAPATQGKP